MALRRRGKKGYYSAYFRTVKVRPDGTLKYATVTVCLGTADLITARAMEADLMAKNQAARLHQRAKAQMIKLEIAAGNRPVEDLPVITRDRKRKRFLLSEGIGIAEKYRHVSYDQRKIWNRFVKYAPVKYFDEVTPAVALEYLQSRYGDPDKGKSFDNNKSGISGIFKFCLVDTDTAENPFARIPDRRYTSDHQRPFTLDEFRAIYKMAEEPWKTAVLVAWHTGLRQESVFNLRWSKLDGDVITAKPGKTARYGREVQIPLHPQVMKRLEELPRVNDFLFGCFKFSRKSSGFKLYFGKLLDSLGIFSSDAGIVNFNCFRNSFITRCDEKEVPRHATRGVVGQVSDKVTDLYSHDLATARRIQKFPWVDLD